MKKSVLQNAFVCVLIALSSTCFAQHAQQPLAVGIAIAWGAALERIQREIVASWIVDVIGEARTRTLNIREAKEGTDGVWTLDATYGFTDGSQSAVKPHLRLESDAYRLEFTTQAGSVIIAEGAGNRTLTGTLTPTAGIARPVRLVRTSDDEIKQRITGLAVSRAVGRVDALKWLERDSFQIYIPNSDFVYRTYPKDGYTSMTGWIDDCAYDFTANEIRRIPTKYSVDDDGKLWLEFDMARCKKNNFGYMFTGTTGAIYFRDAKGKWILGPQQFEIALIGIEPASDEARSAYLAYTSQRSNKAFMVNSRGAYSYASGKESIESAIEASFLQCRKSSNEGECWLYDVNGMRINQYAGSQALVHIEEIRARASVAGSVGQTNWQSLAVGCRSPSDGEWKLHSDGAAPVEKRGALREGAVAPPARPASSDRFAPPPRTIAAISAAIRTNQLVHRDEYAACRALAASAPPVDEERKALAGFYQARSLAARRLGSLRQYIDDLRSAVSLARGTNIRADVLGGLLLDLSAAEYEGGNIARAIELRIEGLRVSPNLRGTGRSSWFGSLANLYAEHGQIREAEAALKDGRELWQSAQTSILTPGYRDWIEAAWLWAGATIYRTKGQFSLAEANSRKGLEAMGRVPLGGSVRLQKNTDWLIDMLHLELALSLLGQTRLAEAEIEARRAFERALRRHGSMSVQTGFMLTNGLIPVLMEQERYEDTMELANSTISMYAALGAEENSWVLSDVRGHVADSLVYQRRWLGALEQFDIIRAGLAHDASTFERRFNDRVPLNLALIKGGHVDRALPQLEASLKRRSADLGDDNYATAEVRGAFAMALAAKGQHDRAAAEFQRAVPVLVSSLELTDGVATARHRRTVLILEGYIDFLADQSLRLPEPKSKTELRAEAFRIADIVRAHSVTRAISANAARSVAKVPELSDLARREQDLQRQLGGLLQLLSEVAGSTNNDRSSNSLAQLQRQIDDLRVHRASVREDLGRRYPEYFRLVAPEAPTVAHVRQNLAPGETLLATYTTDNRTYVWAIPRDGELRFAIAPLGSAELMNRVAVLRRALDSPGTTVTDIPAYDVKSASALYEALLRPVEDAWRDATTIVAVPSEALAPLPLALLPVAATDGNDGSNAWYRRVPWLIRQRALVVLPSVASLVSARRTGASSSVSRLDSRPFVGFGDPVFRTRAYETGVREAKASRSEEGDALLPVASVSSREAIASKRTALLELRAAPQTGRTSSVLIGDLPALPETADELRSIAKALHADLARDLHLREDASEATLQELNDSGELSRYRVISFATHGLVPNDLDGLTEPALALTNPDVSGGGGDGLLTMGEVLALRLDADWVVLSACNTAASEGRGASAFSGLGRAFFHAGARALLLSNWSVETTSAKLLMSDVFERLAANPIVSRAEALRQSMLAMLDQGVYRDASGQAVSNLAHPIFWAPFSLVGDGR